MALHLCHAHGAALDDAAKAALNLIASSWACDESWASAADFEQLKAARASCDCAKAESR